MLHYPCVLPDINARDDWLPDSLRVDFNMLQEPMPLKCATERDKHFLVA